MENRILFMEPTQNIRDIVKRNLEVTDEQVHLTDRMAEMVRMEKGWPLEACKEHAILMLREIETQRENKRLLLENDTLYKEKREAELEARTDKLTGIANTRAYVERMNLDIAQASRYGEPFGLIMIDIDHFKKFNDDHGHDVGDVVLREVAQILEEETRDEVDLVARYGGEEFMVVLSSTDIEGTKITADKLVKAIEERTKNRDFPPVTISAGVTSFDQKIRNTEEDMRKAADTALYHSKVGDKAGNRNRAISFETGMVMPEKDKAKAPAGAKSMTGEQIAKELIRSDKQEASSDSKQLTLPDDPIARIQILEALLENAKSELNNANQKRTGTEG